MLNVRLSKQAKKFLSTIPVKHASQIAKKILLLVKNDNSIQTTDLKGYYPYRRAKSGEYRIIFFIEKSILHITMVGKRNDDEVYKLLERFMS